MKKQTGYSQIEVLVSVLVLAIGFLGMAGLQATSLQNSQKSVFRTQAAYLSYEILDRMRANEALIGSYETLSTGTTFTAVDCISQSCDDTQMAAFDVTEWKCSLGVEDACNALPTGYSMTTLNSALSGAQGSVTQVSGSRVRIEITWNEGRGQTVDDSVFVLETVL